MGKRCFPLIYGLFPETVAIISDCYLSFDLPSYKMRKTVKPTSQCLGRWTETLWTRSPCFSAHSIFRAPFNLAVRISFWKNLLTSVSSIHSSLLSSADWIISWRCRRGDLRCDRLTPSGPTPYSSSQVGKGFNFCLDLEAEDWHDDELPHQPC